MQRLQVILKKKKKQPPSQPSGKCHIWSVHLEAPCSYQQECPLLFLLLISNHHHITAAWHRLGYRGNHATHLPLPVYPGNRQTR